MPHIIIIDGLTLNPGDLSWKQFNALGDVEVYTEETEEEGGARLHLADIIIANKFILDRNLINELPKLKCICVSATGINNVDLVAAKENNITVCNASGYSTVSTAQHTIALLLALTNKCESKNRSVNNGDWTASGSWCDNSVPNVDLNNLTMGIIGVGAIGSEVAKIGRAFGMKTIGYKRSQASGTIDGVSLVDLDTLFGTSDVVTLHCPLNEESREIINATTLAKMKDSAFLINASRGGLINESALRKALDDGRIAGAAVDVLSSEPPSMDNPLIGAPNCIITPHIAWGSKACRSRLMNITLENVKAFISGSPQNVVS